MAFFQGLPWHEGEDRIHAMTRVPPADNPTHPMLSQNAAYRVSISPTIALGAIDEEGRVWCTLWGGGPAPIAQQVARGGVIGIRTRVDVSFDPVVQILYGGKSDGEVIQHNPTEARFVSGLSINLMERDRVKLFGKMLAGCLIAHETQAESTTSTAENSSTGTQKGQTGEAQLVLQITQSLGNCPKYINKKAISTNKESIPYLASDSSILSQEAIAHIRTADVFFVASRGPEDMDCNHRGGAPGFLRVKPQDSTTTSSVLVWPEYSGNNLYQTLGNIISNPSVGLVIPNLVNGNVLYVTGKAEILIDSAATSVIQKTKLAVQLTVTAARYVLSGLTFRGVPSESNLDTSSSNPVLSRDITDGLSPYNPRIRYLASEITASSAFDSGLPPDEYRGRNSASLSATLIKKTKLTPTIYKYRFRLTSSNPQTFNIESSSAASIAVVDTALWKPGQYIALDFSDELYMGYSHMRDDNPEALNDDFTRTFTVASRFPSGSGKNSEPEFEIVIRSVGTATKWLSHQNDRSGIIHIGVLGFGGEFSFSTPEQPTEAGTNTQPNRSRRRKNVFIAAGIGITPLLGQLGPDGDGNDTSNNAIDGLLLFWTLHISDIGLLVDVLESCPAQLRKNTRIFVTGTDTNTVAGGSKNLQKLAELEEGRQAASSPQQQDGAVIERRRLMKADLMDLEEKEDIEIENWYFCTGPKMQKDLLAWLDGRNVLYEKFDY